jgi:hypothetical protein
VFSYQSESRSCFLAGIKRWTVSSIGPFPVNFRKLVGEVDAQRGGDKQQIVIRNTEQSAFDFGDSAAG